MLWEQGGEKDWFRLRSGRHFSWVLKDEQIRRVRNIERRRRGTRKYQAEETACEHPQRWGFMERGMVLCGNKMWERKKGRRWGCDDELGLYPIDPGETVKGVKQGCDVSRMQVHGNWHKHGGWTDATPQLSKNSACSSQSPSLLDLASALSHRVRHETQQIPRTQVIRIGIQTNCLLHFVAISLHLRLKRLWIFSYLESPNCHEAIFTALSHISIFFRYGHSWNGKYQCHQQYAQGEWERRKMSTILFKQSKIQWVLPMQGWEASQWVNQFLTQFLLLSLPDVFWQFYGTLSSPSVDDAEEIKKDEIEIILLYICTTWTKRLFRIFQ